jgi:GcrA cell cycle regulator
MGIHWSDEKVQALKLLWADPTLSLSDMADRLGIETRNAIAGKANRLGLPLRRQPNSRQGQRAAAKERKPPVRASTVMRIVRKPRLKQPESVMPAGEPPHLHLTLLQLTDATCKFPRGDDRFTFCGHSIQPDSPYCSFHHRLCYQPPERRAPNSMRRAA